MENSKEENSKEENSKEENSKMKFDHVYYEKFFEKFDNFELGKYGDKYIIDYYNNNRKRIYNGSNWQTFYSIILFPFIIVVHLIWSIIKIVLLIIYYVGRYISLYIVIIIDGFISNVLGIPNLYAIDTKNIFKYFFLINILENEDEDKDNINEVIDNIEKKLSEYINEYKNLIREYEIKQEEEDKNRKENYNFNEALKNEKDKIRDNINSLELQYILTWLGNAIYAILHFIIFLFVEFMKIFMKKWSKPAAGFIILIIIIVIIIVLVSNTYDTSVDINNELSQENGGSNRDRFKYDDNTNIFDALGRLPGEIYSFTNDFSIFYNDILKRINFFANFSSEIMNDARNFTEEPIEELRTNINNDDKKYKIDNIYTFDAKYINDLIKNKPQEHFKILKLSSVADKDLLQKVVHLIKPYDIHNYINIGDKHIKLDTENINGDIKYKISCGEDQTFFDKSCKIIPIDGTKINDCIYDIKTEIKTENKSKSDYNNIYIPKEINADYDNIFI